MQDKSKEKFPVIIDIGNIFFDTDSGFSPDLVLMILMNSENEG